MPERADDSARWRVRRAMKAAVAGALCSAGARWLVRSVARKAAGGTRVLILSYHLPTRDFAADATRVLPSLLISAATLKRQLEQLAREREIVTLAEACRLLDAPAASPSRRASAPDVVVVTFDDGYVGVYEEALPLLRHLRVPAVVYVASGFIGTSRRLLHDRLFAALGELAWRRLQPQAAGLPPHAQALLDACVAEGPASTLDRLVARIPHQSLSELADALDRRLGLRETDLPPATRLMHWDDLRALQASGVEVGGHTVNHVALANVPFARARAEIRGCREQIAAAMGEPPRHFAYPNGYYTARIRQAVAEAGFSSAVTTEDTENRHGGDPLTLKRKTVWENSTMGARRYSSALAACNLDGVFGALGWQRPVSGERPDRPEPDEAAVPAVERVAG